MKTVHTCVYIQDVLSKWLNVQLTRMIGPKMGTDGIGIEVEVHLEVDKVGVGIIR